VAGEECLSPEEQLGETAMLALRLRREGIDFDRFRARFRIEPRIRWREQLAELSALGLLEIDEQQARLTDAGLLVSNEIGARFL
jgi:coproporphyrinogen III oxidase-like Fe-S oxidoreductase